MSERSLLYTSGLAEDTCAEHNDEGVRRLRQLKTPKLSTDPGAWYCYLSNMLT